MALIFADIEFMNKNLENQVFDRKSKGILSHPGDLAELMVAFGNNKFVSEDFGGVIVIGINNKGKYEKLVPKQGHEEAIMNIAQQKIYPPMTPTFEVISDGSKTVYAITIPKMTSKPYALKTPQGYVYKQRVGSTIRDLVYDEIILLTKDEDNSDLKEQRIESHFPRSTNKPFIKITCIPIDANRQLISFDKENTKWLKSNEPKFSRISTIILKQNDIHYESGNFPSRDTVWYVLNQFGDFSGIEIIRIHDVDIVHLGRQTVFLLSGLHFIEKIYQKFRYSGRVSIKLEIGNVQGKNFQNTEVTAPGYDTGKKFEINPIPIKRIISLDLLNIERLTASIFIEICRACDWTIDDQEFQKFLEYLKTKVNIIF